MGGEFISTCLDSWKWRWLLELVAGSHAGADIRGKSAHLCPSGMWPPRPPQYLHFNIAAATKSEYREFGIIFI